ncbi:MAG TPA: transglycosylase SLT domain-containing protein, partial [Bacteroidales bacterium]|nr:transglycosylase SLT domain-containing protein [Bacteroidales bacterium]
MKPEKKGVVFLIVATIVLFSTFFILKDKNIIIPIEQVDSKNSDKKLDENVLHVLLFTHYTDYFIHQGIPMGFQYELLQKLATSLDKKIDITLENDPNLAFSAVFSNQYDIVAMDFKQSAIVKQLVTTSLPHSQSYPVLIERKGRKNDNIDTIHRIYIPAHFPSFIYLDSLPENTIWKIKYSSSYTIEELYDLLDAKKIDYLVSDYHTALTLLPFYSNLKISYRLGDNYDRNWVLNDNNHGLNKQINHWLSNFTQSPKYKILTRKYFTPYNTKNIPDLESRYKKISPYDLMIKKHAKKSGIDWRFIASIMYQESRFVATAVGIGNSFGLMQFMPSTGERYNVSQNSSEEEQIKAGVEYLQSMHKYFSDIENDEERLKFLCASYNAGAG